MGSSVRRIARHYGCSLRLSSGSIYARTAASATLSPGAGSFTLAFWFKGNDPASGNNIAAYGATSVTNGWILYTGPGKAFLFLINGVARLGSSDVIYSSSDWSRYVVACDASNSHVRVSRDGVLVIDKASAAWAAMAANDYLSLGASPDNNSAFPESLADFIYDVGHAWTAADVLADYQSASPPNTYTHRWPLDDGYSTTARATRGGLALTLTGATWASDSPDRARDSVVNYVADSAQVANTANWQNIGLGTTTAYGGALPAGFTSATLLTNDASTGTHRSAGNNATVGAIRNGAKVFVQAVVKKVAGNDWIALGGNAGGAAKYLRFSTGALGVGGGGAIESGVDDLGGGWFRLWFSYTATTTPWPILYMADADGSVSYTHTANADQVACAGIQVEEARDGQTTPSPFVVTGSAPLSVFGMRETRQNWLQRSDDISQSAWSRTGLLSVSTDGTVAPDGTLMQKMVESTANSVHVIQQIPTPTTPPSAMRTLYAVVKYAGRQWVSLFTDQLNQGAIFDVQNGVLGISTFNGSGGTPRIRSLGNGFYLISVTCTAPGDARFALYLMTGNNFGAGTYTGDGVSGLYVGRTGMAQTDDVPAHITTTTSPANSNGPPRNAALDRGLVTNLVLQSESIATAPWTRTGATAPASASRAVGPGGSLVGFCTLTDDASGIHYAQQAWSGLTPGKVYVFSAFVTKTAGAGFAVLQFGASALSYFNLNTGALGSYSGAVLNRTIEPTSVAGVYRISVMAAATATNQNSIVLLANADGGVSYTGPSQQVDVGGVMVEEAAPWQTTPSPYCTSGATVGTGPRDYRQNLIAASEDRSNAAWSRAGGSVGAGVGAPPSFGSTSDALVEDASNGVHYCAQVGSNLQATGRYIFAAAVKAGTRSAVALTGGQGTNGVYFDIAGGTVLGNAGTGAVSSGVVPLGGGWFVVWIVFDRTDTTSASFIYAATGLAGASYAGSNGQAALYIGGTLMAQCSSLPDYVKTTSAVHNPSGAPRSLAA